MPDEVLISILILGGMLLIFAEVCTPTFGTLAAAALVCFAFAIYYCFSISSLFGLVATIVTLIGIPIYVAYMIRFFPKTPIGKRLALSERRVNAGGGVPQSDTEAKLLDSEGVTFSTLRPAGTVTFGDRRVQATAEAGYIPAGTRVRVIRATGMNVVVRPIAEKTK